MALPNSMTGRSSDPLDTSRPAQLPSLLLGESVSQGEGGTTPGVTDGGSPLLLPDWQAAGFHPTQTPRRSRRVIAAFAFCPTEDSPEPSNSNRTAIEGQLNSSPLGILRVQFASGAIVDFHEVSEATYQGLLATESAGGFYHARLKDQYITTRPEGHGETHGRAALCDASLTHNAQPDWFAAWEASIDLVLSNRGIAHDPIPLPNQ